MLPIIDARPVETIKLPFSKKTISLKPYNSSQEKIILQTLTDKNDKANWLVNIKKIIKENLIDKDFDISSLNTIDFMYITIKLRSMSKSQNFDYSYKCPGKKKVIDPVGKEVEIDCLKLISSSDNLMDIIKIKNCETQKVICEMNDSLSFELTVPGLDYFEFLTILDDKQENILDNVDEQSEEHEMIILKQNLELFSNQISYCIKKVIVKEAGKSKIYHEFTPEELREKIIDNITLDDLHKLYDHRNKLVSMSVKVEKKCPDCGFVFEKEAKNFFEFIA